MLKIEIDRNKELASTAIEGEKKDILVELMIAVDCICNSVAHGNHKISEEDKQEYANKIKASVIMALQMGLNTNYKEWEKSIKDAFMFSREK